MREKVEGPTTSKTGFKEKKNWGKIFLEATRLNIHVAINGYFLRQRRPPWSPDLVDGTVRFSYKQNI